MIHSQAPKSLTNSLVLTFGRNHLQIGWRESSHFDSLLPLEWRKLTLRSLFAILGCGLFVFTVGVPVGGVRLYSRDAFPQHKSG